MIVQLIYNAALLIALSSLYGVVVHYRRDGSIGNKLLTGLLFGVISVAGMNLTVHFHPGIFYDGRSIVLVLAGLFGGGYASLVSVFIAASYRALVGGVGTVAGIATIISSAGTGLIFRRLWHNEPYKMGPWALLGVGVVAHILMLACQLLLPWEMALDTIAHIWKPVMAVFPMATLMMGLLLGNEERRVVMENRLRESKASLHIAQEIAHMGSWEYDLKRDEATWSDNTPTVFGLSPHSKPVKYKDFMHAINPEDKHLVLSAFENIKKKKSPVEVELKVVDYMGKLHYIQNKLIPVLENGEVVTIKGVSVDVTDRKTADIRLKNNLREKEILLKEIHHRVKNNLNVIISLLNMQQRTIRTKEDALKAFDEIRNRIFSMSLVHAKLYKSDNFSRIDMKDYIETIIRHYLEVSTLKKQIQADIQVDAIYLDINKAIPCGLIINELVTNILKHAFPNRNKGRIYIIFRPLDKAKLELVIGDDGIGLSRDINISEPGSLGLRIVRLLVDQMQGKLEIFTEKGTVFRIIFPRES